MCPKSSGVVTAATAPISQAEGIRLIKQTFPEDPVTACAIAHAESFPANGHNDNPKTGDDSVGWFQVNLLAHSKKVPADTREGKIAWLKVPANNLKMARSIYVGWGNSWKPWGAYTNGSYKKFIERCT